MKRVLLFLCLFFCAGLIFGIRITFQPLLFILSFLFIITYCTALFLRGRNINCLLYFLIFFCGIFSSSYRIYTITNPVQRFINSNCKIYGQISNDIKKTGYTTSFTVLVDAIETDSKKYSCQCRIRVLDYKNKPIYIIPYNYVVMSGMMEHEDTYKNTKCFSYSEYLERQGISCTLFAEGMENIESNPCGKRFVSRTIYNMVKRSEGIFEKYLKSDISAIMEGVIFGDTSKIKEEYYEYFQGSGIVHIFAVSGYNIWLLYGMLSFLLCFLDDTSRIKISIIIISMMIYVVMSGCSSSVMRAFIMISVVLLGRIVKRKPDIITSLSLAAIVILLSNPLLIEDAGFQLSFVCGASIILIYPKLRRLKVPVPGALKDPLLLNASINIGILPIIIYYFNSVPLYSIAVNIAVIPLVSIFTIAGAVLLPMSFIFEWGAHAAAWIANTAGMMILALSRFVSALPFASLNFITPGIAEICIYYLLLSIILGYVKIKRDYRKAIEILTICVLVFFIYSEAVPKQLKLSFIDVGQGDSILITTPDNINILVDGGGKTENSYSNTDIGKDVLEPYLYSHGVKKLDMVISTHSHEDHLGGLVPVLKDFEVDRFVKTDLCSQDSYDSLINSGILDISKVINVEESDTIKAGKYVYMYVLSPENRDEDENDDSIVIKLVFKDFSALLTGDISSKTAHGLCKDDIRCDVIKIPHHGSADSLDCDFLDAASPRAAVICVGRNNFGHPSPSTIDAIIKRDMRLYRTDINGEVIITTRGKGFEVKTAA